MADKNLVGELQGMIDALQGNPCATASEGGGTVCRPSEKRLEHAAETESGHASGEAGSSSEAAFKKIVALVNVSDRSEKTVRERLGKAGFPQAAIDEAVDWAKDYRFIDDLRFATVLARSRVSQGKGIYGIEQEFLKHGISPADVPGWPQDFEVSDDSEFSRAMDVLERRPPRSKNLRDGAFRKLVQRGFSVSVASEAARAWCDRLEGRI